MKKTSLVLSLFLVATITGAIIAASSNFSVKAEVPHGVISIAFDDNYQNQFDYAFPIMQDYGIAATFYILTDNIGKPGYMTFQQLQILQNSGNEIGSHSSTHATFTSLSESQIRDECSTSKQILQNNGLVVTNFAYPDGATNATVDQIVSDYYRSGRTAYVAPYLMQAPTSQFRLAGFSAETGDSTALSLLKGMVDQVYSANGWALFFFHNIIPSVYTQQYTTSAEDFESFLNYTVSKGVQTLTVNQVLDLTPLSMASNFGTVTPTSDLHSLGETIDIEAFPPAAGEGERYIWVGWNGSGDGSYSGLNNPASITLNGPIRETALWKQEFKLTISAGNGNTVPSAGDHWYEKGAVVSLEAFKPTTGYGERYVWYGWTGTGSGSYSGPNLSASIVMNGPIAQEVSWGHQYFLNVSSFFGVAGGTGWYDSGTTAYATLDQSVVNESSEIRHLFTNWSMDASGAELTSDSIVIDGPKSVIASWKKQYLVVFNQTGLPHGLNPIVLVNSANYGLPYSIWADEGVTIDFAYPHQIPAGFGACYVLAFPSNQSSVTVGSSLIMIAQYDFRYTFEFYAVIAIPLATLATVALVTSLLLVRRKKSHS